MVTKTAQTDGDQRTHETDLLEEQRRDAGRADSMPTSRTGQLAIMLLDRPPKSRAPHEKSLHCDGYRPASQGESGSV